jgi:hypothetical protein
MNASLRALVLARDRHRCRCCGGTALHVDHIWPRALGGTDDRMNLRALCGPCNRRMGTTPPAAMLPLFMHTESSVCRTRTTHDDHAVIARLRTQLGARRLSDRERGLLAIADWNETVTANDSTPMASDRQP